MKLQTRVRQMLQLHFSLSKLTGFCACGFFNHFLHRLLLTPQHQGYQSKFPHHPEETPLRQRSGCLWCSEPGRIAQATGTGGSGFGSDGREGEQPRRGEGRGNYGQLSDGRVSRAVCAWSRAPCRTSLLPQERALAVVHPVPWHVFRVEVTNVTSRLSLLPCSAGSAAQRNSASLLTEFSQT